MKKYMKKLTIMIVGCCFSLLAVVPAMAAPHNEKHPQMDHSRPAIHQNIEKDHHIKKAPMKADHHDVHKHEKANMHSDHHKPDCRK